jgi:hypothetical protein
LTLFYFDIAFCFVVSTRLIELNCMYISDEN